MGTGVYNHDNGDIYSLSAVMESYFEKHEYFLVVVDNPVRLPGHISNIGRVLFIGQVHLTEIVCNSFSNFQHQRRRIVFENVQHGDVTVQELKITGTRWQPDKL